MKGHITHNGNSKQDQLWLLSFLIVLKWYLGELFLQLWEAIQMERLAGHCVTILSLP